MPKIVERLTHPSAPDASFVLPFLVCYRTCATSDEVLHLILARLDLPEPSNKDVAEMVRLHSIIIINIILYNHYIVLFIIFIP